MGLFDWIGELISRAFERKKTLIFFLLLFLASFFLGIFFLKTPIFFEYHLRVCDRFLDRVCYSDRNVFSIFFERFCGNLLFLVLIFAGGLHPAALVLPSVMLCYRAYLFGGTLHIFFTVYRASGVFVALCLYLPIHLLLDAVFLLSFALDLSRAFCFRFSASDWRELSLDLLLLGAAVLLFCLLEMLLLAALFHPIGNLL